MGALVVVTGCRTGVGKTHTSEALILCLRDGGSRVGSFKPIETGVADAATGSEGEDSRRLATAGMFHVKQRYSFVPPISPHLAAEQAGTRIDLVAILNDVRAARSSEPSWLIVELAGGLFSPLTLHETNADLVVHLQPDLHLLIAANRIGVLHDVLGAVRAAATVAGGLKVDAVVLVADASTDASQESNARELRRFGVPCLGTLPRAPSSALARDAILTELRSRILR